MYTETVHSLGFLAPVLHSPPVDRGRLLGNVLEMIGRVEHMQRIDGNQGSQLLLNLRSEVDGWLLLHRRCSVTLRLLLPAIGRIGSGTCRPVLLPRHGSRAALLLWLLMVVVRLIGCVAARPSCRYLCCKAHSGCFCACEAANQSDTVSGQP